MKIEITPIDAIDDGILATVEGQWDHHEIAGLAAEIKRLSPTYLVLDPTNIIAVSTQATPIEGAIEIRRKNNLTIIHMLVENPRMLYIIINRNENPAFLSSMPLYEEYGVVDRYFFVKTLDEALDIIRRHQVQ